MNTMSAYLATAVLCACSSTQPARVTGMVTPAGSSSNTRDRLGTRVPGGDGALEGSAAIPTEATEKAAAVLDRALLGKRALELSVSDGACLLRISDQQDTITLAPSPPCHFLRRGGKVQSFGYPERGVQSVAIIAGTPVTQQMRELWKLPNQEVCGQETQGVLIREAGVSVTEKVHRGGVACRDLGLDEKEFFAFAHDE